MQDSLKKQLRIPQQTIVSNRFLSQKDLQSLRSASKSMRASSQKQSRLRDIPKEELKRLIQYADNLYQQRLDDEECWAYDQYGQREYAEYYPAMIVKYPFRYDLKKLVRNLGDDYAYIIDNFSAEYKKRFISRRKLKRITEDMLLSVVGACPNPLAKPFRRAVALAAIRMALPFNLNFEPRQNEFRSKLIIIHVDTNKSIKIDNTISDVLQKLINDATDPDFARYKKTIQQMIIACLWYLSNVHHQQPTQQLLKLLPTADITIDQLIH